jgi:hypothetical protein
MKTLYSMTIDLNLKWFIVHTDLLVNGKRGAFSPIF